MFSLESFSNEEDRIKVVKISLAWNFQILDLISEPYQ